MWEVKETPEYVRWFNKLRDVNAQARIQVRIKRLSKGHAGDYKPVSGGVLELRIDYGPGYRIYFTRRGHELIILLAGGDKSSQASDIKSSLRIIREL